MSIIFVFKNNALMKFSYKTILKEKQSYQNKKKLVAEIVEFKKNLLKVK